MIQSEKQRNRETRMLFRWRRIWTNERTKTTSSFLQSLPSLQIRSWIIIGQALLLRCSRKLFTNGTWFHRQFWKRKEKLRHFSCVLIGLCRTLLLESIHRTDAWREELTWGSRAGMEIQSHLNVESINPWCSWFSFFILNPVRSCNAGENRALPSRLLFEIRTLRVQQHACDVTRRRIWTASTLP